MAGLILALGFVACQKGDTNDGDLAGKVSGTYTGKLKYGTEVVEDAYVVNISKVSSSVVSVSADFLNGSAKFNVEKSSNGFNLISETIYNINISIYEKTVTINYKTEGGYMLTFQGTRD